MTNGSPVKPVLFNFFKFCRIVCLIISVFIINGLWKKEESFTGYYFWFLAYLTIGTILLFIIKNDMVLFFQLLLTDYIIVLLFQYFDPHIIVLELIWIPVLLLLIVVIFPVPFNFSLVFFMGIPGYIFLNYANYAGLAIIIGENSYSNYHVGLAYCVPVTLFSIVIGFLNSYIERNVGRLRALERLNEQFNKINRDIMHKVFVLQTNASQEERKRVSKEIHDTAGYVFINLIMMLQAAQAVFNKDLKKTESLITDARDYAERGINEIRYILRGIRNYNPAFISLQNSLFGIGNSFEKATGVKIEINYGNWPRTFNKDLDSFFMSLMQEALTNALKHGHASSISVQCWLVDFDITMSILDNGTGCVMPVKKGIGLSSIEEYTSQKNGHLSTQSSDAGFRLMVIIPAAER